VEEVAPAPCSSSATTAPGPHRTGPPLRRSPTAPVLHRTRPPPCRAHTGHQCEGAGWQGGVLPRRERRRSAGSAPQLNKCLSNAEPHEAVLAVRLETGRVFLVHELPVVHAYCRCLNLSTSRGGTRSKVEGEGCHDLEPEGMHEDTRHKIYTGSGSRSSYPTSCLG
jgi:hypothetical protein